MLLLSSPPSGRQRRASLLLLLLLTTVLLCVVPVSASPPARGKCRPINCVKENRHVCTHGSSHCGPCLQSFEENEDRRCVKKTSHRQHGTGAVLQDLDEEIDYLHSVIAKQQVTEIEPPRQQLHLLAAVTSQTNVKKSKTDASKQNQKSRARLPDETQQATTTAPLPNTPTPQARATVIGGRGGPIAVPTPKNDSIIVILISLCVVVGTVAVILATVCYVKMQKESRLAQKVDYPAFGGAGVPAASANGASMGDKTLAQSAQMYHYQHQKQQMLSMGNQKPEQKTLENEVTSDEEEVGGDFTVYECPGLAPTGEMEVKNPLFDDSTLHYQGNHN